MLPPVSPGQTDHLCLAAAWLLGAADLARTERGPLPPGSDPKDPAYGLTNAFGDHPYLYEGPAGTESPVLLESDPSGVADLITDAATLGWVHWVFKPAAHNAFVLRHLRRLYPNDRSILSDGTRPPRDDLPTRPLAAHAANRRTVYDLVARNG